MPVKINDVDLDYIQVNGANVKRIGVDGVPVLLNCSGKIYTSTTKSFAQLSNSAFSTNYGVWGFQLYLLATSTGAGINGFNFTVSVKFDFGSGDLGIWGRTFSIGISGNDASKATVKIESSNENGNIDVDGTRYNVDFTKEPSNMNPVPPVLALMPTDEGNHLSMSFLGGDSGKIGFTSIPKLDWYNENYPRYAVSVSGEQGNLFDFNIVMYSQKIILNN